MLEESLRIFIFFGSGFALLKAVGQASIKKKNAQTWGFTLFYLSLAALQMAAANPGEQLRLSLPAFSLVELPFLYAMGPAIYIVFTETLRKTESPPRYWPHMIVPVCVLLALLPYYVSPSHEKVLGLMGMLADVELTWPEYLYAGGAISSMAYLAFTVYRVSAIFNPRVLRLENTAQYVAYLAVIGAVVLSLFAIGGITRQFLLIRFSVAFITIGLCMNYVVGIRFPRYAESVAAVVMQAKYQQSHLSTIDTKKLASDMRRLLEEEFLYRDEELTLGRLSEELEVSMHQLSQFLNEQMQKSFSLFINEYRVKEAQKLLIEKPDVNVLSIAYEVGFNSKSAFHRAFSKIALTSPKEYRSKHS